ncbi:MAG TPA: transposase [Bryobacteraceae bacterium]|nr:transposase [Bryobacteraceae bacterium]
MLTKTFLFFVGIDWATEEHRVCLINADGQIISERSVLHSGPGIPEVVEWIAEKTCELRDKVAVAIEVPRGAIVVHLITRSHPVFHINPKQLDRFRDRHTVAALF